MENRFLLGGTPNERISTMEEILRRQRMDSQWEKDGARRIWSDEDAGSFEEGLRYFGKNFRSIKEKYVS